jgi:ligand-binding sensor domain-containing protein
MDRGLYRFTRDGSWRHLTRESGLAHNAVRCVFEDREGNLWVGTDGGGLQRLRPRVFRNWGIEQGMPDQEVSSVAADAQGRLFTGTLAHGVQCLRADTVRAFPRPGSTAPISHFPILALLADSKGCLWAGTAEDGLHLVDGARHRHFNAQDVGLPGGPLQVYSLLEDSRRRLWIGTSRGLCCFDGGTFRAYRPDPDPGLDSADGLAEDPRTGAIWTGGSAGHLYRLDGGRLGIVSPGVELPQPQTVRCLHIGPDGTVWAGTSESGLVWWREGRWGAIAEKQGLPTHSVGAILEGPGHFWIASDKGVLRVRRDDLEAVRTGRAATLDCQVFDKSDGLATGRCSLGRQNLGVEDRDGRLWFATHKGLAMVDPARVPHNDLPPPVRIQEVYVDGRLAAREEAFHTSAPAAAAPLDIPAGARRVEIRYAGLCLSAPDKVRYRYRVEGLDADWVDVGGRREAYLQDLKPGPYRFRVQAANNDGVWDEAGAAVEFEVQPRFYQTRWFYGGCAAAVVLAAFAAHGLRIRRLKARERELSRRVEERTQTLRQTAEKLRDAKEAAEGALARVKQLQGLLPICSYCKRVRDDHDYWQQVEAYVAHHSEAQFTHGICPDCFEKKFGPVGGAEGPSAPPASTA